MIKFRKPLVETLGVLRYSAIPFGVGYLAISWLGYKIFQFDGPAFVAFPNLLWALRWVFLQQVEWWTTYLFTGAWPVLVPAFVLLVFVSLGLGVARRSTKEYATRATILNNRVRECAQECEQLDQKIGELEAALAERNENYRILLFQRDQLLRRITSRSGGGTTLTARNIQSPASEPEVLPPSPPARQKDDDLDDIYG